MKVGELGVLPKVRAAAKDTLIVADGFSCRTPIEQATDRRGLHLAQVMQMALHEGSRGTSGEYPEKNWQRLRRNDGYVREVLWAGAALAMCGVLSWRSQRSRKR